MATQQALSPLAELDAFFTKYVALTSQTATAMLSQSVQGEQEIINVYGLQLSREITELATYVKVNAGICSAEVISEIGIILRVTAAQGLLESAARLTVDLSTTKAKIALADHFILLNKIAYILIKEIQVTVSGWILAQLELISEQVVFLISAGTVRLTTLLVRRAELSLVLRTRVEEFERATAWREFSEV